MANNSVEPSLNGPYFKWTYQKILETGFALFVV